MNLRKNVFYLFLMAIALYSCSPLTQLYETKSTLPIDQRRNQFIFDNDTVRIEYNFWGDKGILSFEIYNKLNTPIYIDWKKSSFIQNSQKFDYWINQTITNSAGYSVGYYRNSWLYQSTSATSNPERILFLAPKSFIKAERFNICSGASLLSKNSQMATISVPEHPGKMIKIKHQDYELTSSPLVFRNFITYSLTEKFENESYINNIFYVSKIYEMKRSEFLNKVIQVDRRTRFVSSFSNPSFFYVNL